MRQEIISIYQFEELSKEAQTRAIESYRNASNDDFEHVYEYLEEDFINQLECIGFYDVKISYSGFSCQGDGASFTASIDFEKLFNHFIMDCDNYAQARKYYRYLLLSDIGGVDGEIVRTAYRYSHENTCTFNLEAYQTKLTDDEYSEVENMIENLRISLCRKLYRMLEKEYDYIQSDEHIIENIIINEYEFSEDGERY